jgi:hypothetical protein
MTMTYLKLPFVIAILLSVLLSSCVSHAPKSANWPKHIPSREFFVAQYEADLENKKSQEVDEFLLWVIRFYEGWELYRNGWTKVTADSLVGVKDPAVAKEIKTKMDYIGEGIAKEWPKSKKDRRILTRHIVVWGNALIESMKRDQELALINRVVADLDGLMANQVGIEDIKAERYFPRDKDDVFF